MNNTEYILLAVGGLLLIMVAVGYVLLMLAGGMGHPLQDNHARKDKP